MTPGIIDYGGGNLRSVINAIRALGEEPVVVTRPDQAGDVERLIFPGQGAFGDCMERLAARGLDGFLRDWIRADRPYFGICVGYQLLFDESEEAPGVAGLGVVGGKVLRFADEPGLKIPHMGWNQLETRGTPHACLDAGEWFYFVHSYHAVPDEPDVVRGVAGYGPNVVTAAVGREHVLATQFHPEKSQNAGLSLLTRFLRG